jgi:hypothetical protein
LSPPCALAVERTEQRCEIDGLRKVNAEPGSVVGHNAPHEFGNAVAPGVGAHRRRFNHVHACADGVRHPVQLIEARLEVRTSGYEVG